MTDISLLVAGMVMTFCFFGKLVGINWGTFVMALINGTIIGRFSKLFDKIFDFQPWLKKFSALFELDKKEETGKEHAEPPCERQSRE
ncbi:MAG: hypothetical protein MRZ13_05180 [Clostridiales bacterium]|nr:hypothetical protein [Clostridiales bacterium]